MSAFFAGAAVQPCAPSANPFAPTPLTPTKLAYVHPVPGLSGKPGLTLTAVLDTIVDLNRQVVGATLQADAAATQRIELRRAARRLREAELLQASS